MAADISWMIALIPTAASIIMGTFIFVSRKSFRTGRVEASTAGKIELASNLITNAIAELERTKKDISKLADSATETKIDVAKLHERCQNIQDRLDGLGEQMQRLLEDRPRRRGGGYDDR
jgi:hypothetical protein